MYDNGCSLRDASTMTKGEGSLITKYLEQQQMFNFEETMRSRSDADQFKQHCDEVPRKDLQDMS